MGTSFQKVPFEEYLAFFETKAKTDDYEQWIRIQYDYMKEPSWNGLGTYEIYSPNNFAITKGSSFVIPTGFRYVGERYEIVCIPCFGKAEFEKITFEEAGKHIVIRGTTLENRCFQAGDRLMKFVLED